MLCAPSVFCSAVPHIFPSGQVLAALIFSLIRTFLTWCGAGFGSDDSGFFGMIWDACSQTCGPSDPTQPPLHDHAYSRPCKEQEGAQEEEAGGF